MKNAAYFLAMVTKSGEELIETSGIRRPVVMARCYDSKGQLSDIFLVFSEICEARKSSALSAGDVIYFQAVVGECPEGQLAFYPGEIHIIRKNSGKNVCLPEMSDRLLNSRMAPFERERNAVLFGGIVDSTKENFVRIKVPRPEFLRGEVLPDSYVWVDTDGNIPEVGSDVFFAGEVSEGRLKGELYGVR